MTPFNIFTKTLQNYRNYEKAISQFLGKKPKTFLTPANWKYESVWEKKV